MTTIRPFVALPLAWMLACGGSTDSLISTTAGIEGRLPVLGASSAQAAATVDTGTIAFPLAPTVWVTLSSKPIHNNFTRYLSFENVFGERIRVAIAFAKTSGLTWTGTITETGLERLQSLAETGHRNYWDRMFLENRGGSTSIEIEHLFVQMNYDAADLPSGVQAEIVVVDQDLDQTLAAGYDELDLAAAAQATRERELFAWQSIDLGGPRPLLVYKKLDVHQALELAVQDLGKSGSDGALYLGESDPKYGNANELLCSEFVSWYYHAAGFKLTRQIILPLPPFVFTVVVENFKDIRSTATMRDAFETVDQLCCYHLGRQQFENTSSGDVCTPQPGDFLERRKDGSSQHSMMLLRWDDDSKVAEVINGPWPVTVRSVDIQAKEEGGYDFCLGQLE